jgi:hypothetical protein
VCAATEGQVLENTLSLENLNETMISIQRLASESDRKKSHVAKYIIIQICKQK